MLRLLIRVDVFFVHVLPFAVPLDDGCVGVRVDLPRARLDVNVLAVRSLAGLLGVALAEVLCVVFRVLAEIRVQIQTRNAVPRSVVVVRVETVDLEVGELWGEAHVRFYRKFAFTRIFVTVFRKVDRRLLGKNREVCFCVQTFS